MIETKKIEPEESYEDRIDRLSKSIIKDGAVYADEVTKAVSAKRYELSRFTPADFQHDVDRIHNKVQLYFKVAKDVIQKANEINQEYKVVPTVRFAWRFIKSIF